MTTQNAAPPLDWLWDKHRRLRDTSPAPLNLRCYRALSWLDRAVSIRSDDADGAFLFAWIAFNAAYAREVGEDESAHARADFNRFFQAIVECDARDQLGYEVWHHFDGPIVALLENRFVFGPFWKHHNGSPLYADWEDRFQRALVAAGHAMRNHDTPVMLSILFDRLYVLRNQLVHGGATWNSGVNRQQVEDGAEILLALMPIFIDTLMSNADRNWGDVNYPVIQ